MLYTVKYFIFIIGIVIAVFVVIVGTLIATWLHLNIENQFLIGKILEKTTIFPVIGTFILIWVIGSLVSLLFHYFIIPILKLAEETKLISNINPEYKIPLRGSREVKQLTEIINDSGQIIFRLKNATREEIKNANAKLEEERTRLVALMSELPSGVIVCNMNGQILLYNRQAQNILYPTSDVDNNKTNNKAGIIGLGRSVFNIINRDPIIHTLDFLQQCIEQNHIKPATKFITSYGENRFLGINITLVIQDNKNMEISGFVLIINDVTEQIKADNRRDNLIQSVTYNLQNTLWIIREYISTMISNPGLGIEQLNDYSNRIDEASMEIKKQLDQASHDYIQHVKKKK